jgi:sigma-B regulation protein RsbU (phosphoserine phosphatase)
MFATLFFGVINPYTGIMAYINGGHEPVVITDSSGIKQSLEPTGPAVGMMVDMKFEIQQVQIDPGDILIGYTDGVIEALAPNGDFFTRKRLRSIFEQAPTSASDLVDRIKTNVSAHVKNAPPSDDITLLAVQRLA